MKRSGDRKMLCGELGLCANDYKGGFGLLVGDLGLGCGEWLWISGKRVGIC